MHAVVAENVLIFTAPYLLTGYEYER